MALPPTGRLVAVEAVAYWAERGLVVPAVDREGAGRTLDRGGRLGRRDDSRHPDPVVLEFVVHGGLVGAGASRRAPPAGAAETRPKAGRRVPALLGAADASPARQARWYSAIAASNACQIAGVIRG